MKKALGSPTLLTPDKFWSTCLKVPLLKNRVFTSQIKASYLKDMFHLWQTTRWWRIKWCTVTTSCLNLAVYVFAGVHIWKRNIAVSLQSFQIKEYWGAGLRMLAYCLLHSSIYGIIWFSWFFGFAVFWINSSKSMSWSIELYVPDAKADDEIRKKVNGYSIKCSVVYLMEDISAQYFSSFETDIYVLHLAWSIHFSQLHILYPCHRICINYWWKECHSV